MNSSKTFSNIRFKKKTAKRFQEFSRRFFKTHTEALQTMLDFFLYNEISPKESLGPNARTLENLIKKRFNGLAAMMKDMEKHGVNPTKAMMELLFEHTPTKNKPSNSDRLESDRNTVKDDAFFKTAFDAIELQKENTVLKQHLNQTQSQFLETLEKVQFVKSSFSKTKLQLNMAVEEYESLISYLKNS